MRQVPLELLSLIFNKLPIWKNGIIVLAKRGYFKRKYKLILLVL